MYNRPETMVRVMFLDCGVGVRVEVRDKGLGYFGGTDLLSVRGRTLDSGVGGSNIDRILLQSLGVMVQDLGLVA